MCLSATVQLFLSCLRFCHESLKWWERLYFISFLLLRGASCLSQYLFRNYVYAALPPNPPSVVVSWTVQANIVMSWPIWLCSGQCCYYQYYHDTFAGITNVFFIFNTATKELLIARKSQASRFRFFVGEHKKPDRLSRDFARYKTDASHILAVG